MENKKCTIWAKLSNTKSIMAIVGSVIIILQTLGIKVDGPYINEVATAICGLLVLLGIINKEGMDCNKWDQ